jgi:hypothetical protein
MKPLPTTPEETNALSDAIFTRLKAVLEKRKIKLPPATGSEHSHTDLLRDMIITTARKLERKREQLTSNIAVANFLASQFQEWKEILDEEYSRNPVKDKKVMTDIRRAENALIIECIADALDISEQTRLVIQTFERHHPPGHFF